MTILSVHGELDLASGDYLLKQVDDALDEGPLVVAIDLRDLSFMDARGVAALIGAGERCQARDRRFTIIRGGHQVDQLLEACGLSNYFDMVSDLDQLPDGELTRSAGL
jgi:anti-anti-sigma factor